MRHLLCLSLSSVLLLLVFITPLNAADFNIKLRKTDINELKQQLMPRFDQSISYLNELLNCLEHGKTVDTCLDEYSLIVEGKGTVLSPEKQERNKKIKQGIENKIDEKNIEPEELIVELKKLLKEAESVKSCLNKGQTANELKDCIIKD
ncbi:MAG: hypothetical protein OQL19_19580 [Gammaproteobacteria bacterium]|nr:hypothetical protein [Gammaproteobacteria bacterium]